MKKITDWFDSLTVYRAGLALHALAACGLAGDFSWHMRFMGENYWIVPHYLMYVGCFGFSLCLFVLWRRKFNVPLYSVFVYPFFLTFYFIWDETLGEYLGNNSGTFWTPTRFGFGMMMIFLMYILYRTNIETNKQILTYFRTMLFFVLPVRFILFLFIPFAVFSSHVELHGAFSLIFSVFAILLVCTASLAHGDESLLLPGILLFSSFRAPFTQFFVNSQNYYGASFSFLYFIVFLLLVTKRTGHVAYALLGVLVVSHIFLLEYAWHTVFNAASFVFSCALAVLFAFVYKEFEDVVMPFLSRTVRSLVTL